MSQENVEIVREVMSLLGSAAKGERIDELLERFDPEVQIDMTRRVLNPGTYEGHAGLRRLGEDVREVWAEFEIEPERFIDAGERVIVLEIRRGRGTGSGIEVEMRSGVVWTLRQGKVIGMETDLKPDEALRAAGLSEYAMSQENIEVVRGWFARLSSGDPAPDLCDPAIEVRNWAESPVPGPYHGHDGLRKWWSEVNDPDIGIEVQMFELENVVQVDEERVVTIQRATGRGRSSGLEIDRLWGAIVGVRDGKISSAVGYPTPAEALEAAGLRE